MEVEILLDFTEEDGKDRGVVYVFIGDDMEEIGKWGDVRRWGESRGTG